MLSALALWFLLTDAPKDSVRTTGHITLAFDGEPTHDPINNAEVRLYSLERVMSTKTDSMGLFIFEQVPVGNYTSCRQSRTRAWFLHDLR